jgi:hypothetical protein
MINKELDAWSGLPWEGRAALAALAGPCVYNKKESKDRQGEQKVDWQCPAEREDQLVAQKWRRGVVEECARLTCRHYWEAIKNKENKEMTTKQNCQTRET